MSEQEEWDIVGRAMVLRKLGKIGVLHAEYGRYWISENELHAYATRVRISIDTLKVMVEEIEAREKMPPKRGVYFEGKVHIAQKNISAA